MIERLVVLDGERLSTASISIILGRSENEIHRCLALLDPYGLMLDAPCPARD